MKRFPRIALLFLLFAAGGSAHAAALNDTGQMQCYDDTGAIRICGPEDDAYYGRDADSVAGVLTKVGAGAAGFDFTKIANDGSALAADAALGSNPTDWACTRDNVTGLQWEMKTASGLHSSTNTYSWYSTDPVYNAGVTGTANGGACTGSNCDTEAFVAAVNAATLCGASDWRLPTIMELKSIVNSGVPPLGIAPTIDANYFPNTQIDLYWTTFTFAGDTSLAWVMNFIHGIPFTDVAFTNKITNSNFVRLVRGAP